VRCLIEPTRTTPCNFNRATNCYFQLMASRKPRTPNSKSSATSACWKPLAHAPIRPAREHREFWGIEPLLLNRTSASVPRELTMTAKSKHLDLMASSLGQVRRYSRGLTN